MNESPQDELEILVPDRDITFSGGETVTVREFSFYETLKLEPTAWPIIQALADLGEEWESIDVHKLMTVFSDHADEFTQLLAASVDRTVDWVRDLPGKDGTLLATTFWGVNQSFFVHRLLALLAPKLKNRQAQNSAGDKSSLPSSLTDTKETVY